MDTPDYITWLAFYPSTGIDFYKDNPHISIVDDAIVIKTRRCTSTI